MQQQVQRFVFLLFTWLCFSLSDSALAAPIDELSEDTERVLLFRTRAGELISESIIGHQANRTLFLSANDIFENLGLETRIIGELSQFQAESQTPALKIQINWKDCQLSLNNNGQKLNCEQFIYFEDELFIEESLLAKMLQSEFTYRPFKSELQIYSEIPYPTLQRIDRAKTKATPKSTGEFDLGFETRQSQAQTLQNFFIDNQVSYLSRTGKSGEGEYYGNLVSDALGHEVQLTHQTSGSTNDFTTGLIRKDYYGTRQNPYVSTYQLGTVVIPSAEMLGGPSGGQGIYITNRKQNQLLGFGQRELEGNLRPDWEVELYINDILFSRQGSNNQGRYRFTGVPLLYGNNRFRLEFYGPQGERQTEYLNSNITQSNLKKNQLLYEAGLSDDNQGMEGLAQLSYGLTQNLSTYTAFTRYHLNNSTEATDFGVVGLNSFWNNFSGSAFFGQDLTERGHFYSLRTQANFRSGYVNVQYTDADKYRSTNFFPTGLYIDKSIQSDMVLSLFGAMSSLYRFQHDIYENNKTENLALQFLVFSLHKFSFQLKNELIKWKENEFQTIYTHLRNQFRVKSEYSYEQIRTLGFEYRNRFFRDSSVFAGSEQNFLTHTLTHRAGYQNRYQNLIAGAEIASDGQRDHQILFRLRSSLGFYSDESHIQASSDLLASRGNVCGKIYIDHNNNKLFDPDQDEPVSGVNVSWMQGNRIYTSNAHGEVYLSDLPIYQHADIQLLHSSLEDPRLVFTAKGYRTFLQKGQCLKLDFPLVFISDIEGQIFKEGQLNPPRTTLLLTNLESETTQTTRTDREGYFLFSSLPPGKYRVEIKNDPKRFEPTFYEIDTQDPESLDQDIYFNAVD